MWTCEYIFYITQSTVLWSVKKSGHGKHITHMLLAGDQKLSARSGYHMDSYAFQFLHVCHINIIDIEISWLHVSIFCLVVWLDITLIGSYSLARTPSLTTWSANSQWDTQNITISLLFDHLPCQKSAIISDRHNVMVFQGKRLESVISTLQYLTVKNFITDRLHKDASRYIHLFHNSHHDDGIAPLPKLSPKQDLVCLFLSMQGNNLC